MPRLLQAAKRGGRKVCGIQAPDRRTNSAYVIANSTIDRRGRLADQLQIPPWWRHKCSSSGRSATRK